MSEASHARRRLIPAFLALAPSVLFAALAASVPLLRLHGSGLVGAAAWGLVLLVSFVGWGSAAAAVLLPGRGLDWGIRSALGMAVVVAGGGLLQVAYLVSPGVLFGMIFGGLVVLAVERWPRRSRLADGIAERVAAARAHPITTVVLCALYALAAFAFLGSFATAAPNLYDDYEAYWAYPKSLLAVGALDAPFSFRRLGSLGGQSYLQSFVLIGSNVWRMNGFDNGICLLSIFGMAHGYAQRRPAALLVTLAFIVGLAYPWHNIGSELSGTVFFLALFRVIAAEVEPITDGRIGLVLGLLGAAGWTLRQNFLVPVLVIIGAVFALHFLRAGEQRPRVFRAGVLSILFVTVFLLPWWLTEYRSSRTFLYPLALGNARPGFLVGGDLSLSAEVQFALAYLRWDQMPVRGLSLFVLASLCLPGSLRSVGIRAVVLGTGAGVAAVVHGCRTMDDVPSVSRFSMPIVLALALAVLLDSLRRLDAREPRPTGRAVAAAVLAVGAVVLQFGGTRDAIAQEYRTWAWNIDRQLGATTTTAASEKDTYYRSVQAAVPEGQPFLEIVDQPFRFDFERNPIIICDMPGGAAPAPGFPLSGGAEELEDYFRKQSIRYLVLGIGPGSPEYNPSRWIDEMQKTPLPLSGFTRGPQHRSMAPVYVGVFKGLEQLTRRHKQLFDDGAIHVVDLSLLPGADPFIREPASAEASPQ